MTKFHSYICGFIIWFVPIVGFSQYSTTDTTGVQTNQHTNYFGISGGYSYGDATLYRLGLVYSIVYGHTVSDFIDIEGSIIITGRDGQSDLGFVQVLSSTAFDGTCLLKPFPGSGFRIGAGISARRRQFFYSAPPIGTSVDDEDRLIRDTGLGVHGKICYTLFQSFSTTIGIQAEGQYFIPIQGEYFFQGVPTTLQKLRFPFSPIMFSLGISASFAF
jgi:hypothetical protein